MTPIIPTPDTLPIPAPVPLIAFLQHLTFLAHLLFMNALFGGLALSYVGFRRGRDPRNPEYRLADAVTKLLPTLFAGTVTFGVAPLLFMQVLFGNFFYTASIAVGWAWLGVIGLLLLAYYATYYNAFRGPRLGAGARGAVALAATLLVALIAFVYSNNMSLMLRPDRWTALYLAAPGGTSLNLGDAELWPRYLHMVLGALAIGGLLLALWGRTRRDAEVAALAVRRGIAFFAWTTAANLAVGLWFVFALPRNVRMEMMGEVPLSTALFGVGFLLGLAVFAIALVMRFAERPRSPVPLATLALVLLAVMVLLRDTVRGGHLAAWFRPEAFTVRTQGLPLALFALLLVAGLAVVAWMARVLLTGGKSDGDAG